MQWLHLCFCFLLVPVVILTLFAALCIIHGCTTPPCVYFWRGKATECHCYRGWIYCSFYCTWRHAGWLCFSCFSGNATATVTMVSATCLQHCFVFYTQYATCCLLFHLTLLVIWFKCLPCSGVPNCCIFFCYCYPRWSANVDWLIILWNGTLHCATAGSLFFVCRLIICYILNGTA